jgi:4-hydroxy-tetrahydrodipicolinate reductase
MRLNMIKAIMNGCNGRMGHVIVDIAGNDNDIEIVAGVDKFGENNYSFPTFKSLAEVDVECDVVIDFSNASGVDELLDTCVSKNLPVVLCTTGLSEQQIAHVKEASSKIAILKSANMSVGVNVLMKVLKEAAKTLAGSGFDMEIVEKHHNQKLDAPSGTAMSLAEVINEAAGGDYEFVYDRSSRREKRPEKEIGISAVRGGTIVGDHDVIFAGTDEVITFSHRAYSRAIFGKGAVEAAKFLAGKAAGMYDMADALYLN